MEHEQPRLSLALERVREISFSSNSLLIEREREKKQEITEKERDREGEMFLSNNSSTSLNNNNNNNNNNNCIDQQPMFDRPFFINDVSPSSKMYPAPPSIHDQLYSSSSFSNTFNTDHHHHHHLQSSSAADDQDFIAAFLQQHQEDLLVGHHQFSQIQQQNTSTTNTTTTTTSSSISKQTGITTTDQYHHQITNLTHLNNMINMEIMIPNKNVVDDGGGSLREPAVALWKKKTSSTTTSKKDRHSKIVTAQGPRDRRMRLSLEIARRFFSLQDTLGFDKASKTVEWLLTKSKGAIKELTRSIKGSSNNTSGGGSSSTSECEVVSVLNVVDDDDDDDENTLQISNTISSTPKEKRVRVARKPTFHPPPLAKDSRAKARAWARERTIEKMRSRSSTAPFPHNINQLRANSSSYDQTGGEESGSQSHDMSLEMVAEVEDHPPAAAAAAAAARSPSSLECQGPVGGEYSFVINRNSPTSTTSPLFFDYNHEIKTSQGLNLNNCNFPENWDIDSAVEHTLAIPSQTTACIYEQQIFNLSESHGSHS